MADPNRTAVTVVALLAIVILVGLAIYFVMEETDDAIEIDIGLQADRPAPVAAPPIRFEAFETGPGIGPAT